MVAQNAHRIQQLAKQYQENIFVYCCFCEYYFILVYLCNGDIKIQNNIPTFEGILPLCVFNEIGCISCR